MKYKFLDKEIKYDGSQLRSLFNYEQGLQGNSIVCFIGPAEVKEHLVDCEDRLANDFISSEKMIHFIIEIFDASLRETVAFQRLFIAMIFDSLPDIPHEPLFRIKRKGDDIFINNKKLSVSIATKSPVSGLIHIGLNIIVGKKCPVEAIGLNDIFDFYLSLDNLVCFTNDLMVKFRDEFESIQSACYKVKGVQ